MAKELQHWELLGSNIAQGHNCFSTRTFCSLHSISKFIMQMDGTNIWLNCAAWGFKSRLKIKQFWIIKEPKLWYIKKLLKYFILIQHERTVEASTKKSLGQIIIANWILCYVTWCKGCDVLSCAQPKIVRTMKNECTNEKKWKKCIPSDA